MTYKGSRQPDRGRDLVLLRIFLVPLVTIWLSLEFSATSADAWRNAGGILTLGGLLTIALGMEHLQAQFGDRPSVGQRVVRSLRSGRRWLLRKLGKGPEPTILDAEPGEYILVGNSVDEIARPGPDATLKHRVEILEQEVKRLDSRIGEVERASQEQDAKLTEGLRTEREERIRADQELRRLVQQLAVGGLRLEAVGLWWLLLGVIATTWHDSLPALPF